MRRFCAEKLAPHADDIDKTNEFPRMRVSCTEEFITLTQRPLLAWITSAFSWTWWKTLTVCHHLLNWLMSLWWSMFSLAQSAGCVLGNTLIFLFVFFFFFQEFWKEMGEMGLLGITAPGETYLFIARCKQKSQYTDFGVKRLQTCKHGQKMFLQKLFKFHPQLERIQFLSTNLCAVILKRLLFEPLRPWCEPLSLTASGARRNGPGLPRALHRDGGDVARVGRHRPQLRRPLQPVRQPDGAARQRQAEGEVHDEGQQPNKRLHRSAHSQRPPQTEVAVWPVISPCTLLPSPVTDGGTRGRAGHERTQLGLRRRLHEAPSQEGR